MVLESLQVQENKIMSQFHNSNPQANIPFSWENKPGMSKVIPHPELLDEDGSCKHLLPLPPGKIIECRKVLALHNLYIPLPPTTFQTPPRTLSKRRGGGGGGSKKEEDPFLAAFMECTMSAASKERSKPSNCKEIRKKDRRLGALEKVGFFSFKCSSEVVEDAMLRVPRAVHHGHERLKSKRFSS